MGPGAAPADRKKLSVPRKSCCLHTPALAGPWPEPRRSATGPCVEFCAQLQAPRSEERWAWTRESGCWGGWHRHWEGSSLSTVPIEGSRAPSSLHQCVFEVKQTEPHHTQLKHQRTAGDSRGLWERLEWAGQNLVGEGGRLDFISCQGWNS